MSSQGNRYIIGLCKTDGNLILVEPMKNRTSSKMCKAYNNLMDRIRQSNMTIKKPFLDNKASKEFLHTIRKQGIE